MDDKPNLEHMWSVSLREIGKVEVTIDLLRLEYLRLFSVKVQGVCGGTFEVEYIKNLHPNLSIDANILTSVEYRGKIVRSEKLPTPLTIKPGDINKIELGCNGWFNPTGADHTYYRRKIIGPTD